MHVESRLHVQVGMNDTQTIHLISFTNTNNPFICSCNIEMHGCVMYFNKINEIKADKKSFTAVLTFAAGARSFIVVCYVC